MVHGQRSMDNDQIALGTFLRCERAEECFCKNLPTRGRDIWGFDLGGQRLERSLGCIVDMGTVALRGGS